MFHTIDITFNFTIPFIHTIMNALKTYTHYESEYDDSKLTKSPIGVRTTFDQSAFWALFLIVRSDIEVLQSLGNHFGLTLSNFGPRSDGKRTKARVDVCASQRIRTTTGTRLLSKKLLRERWPLAHCLPQNLQSFF